jgi:hypothetical protein
VPDLKNKTILILSPQAWGKMFLAKHHYALELAKRGNKVYFLNPPDQESTRFRDAVDVKQIDGNQLFLIEHQLFFPYWLKFKAFQVFQSLMKFQIQKILGKIGQVDIVWSFDIGHLYPFKFFPSQAYKIYHPVDEPESVQSINAASGANIIFSVTKEILEKYKSFKVGKHLVNHGVSLEFLSQAQTRDRQMGSTTYVGLTGNFLRKDIDRGTLLLILRENSNVIFNFWGTYETGSNIGSAPTKEAKLFIDLLKKCPNVIFHGQVDPRNLAREIQQMDSFLICYDIQLDHSKGTNYHKIIEFLSTGKVVVSNNVTAYTDRPNLVQMPRSRENNKELPALFKNVIRELKMLNLPALQLERKMYARDNSYEKQIERIEGFLNRKPTG